MQEESFQFLKKAQEYFSIEEYEIVKKALSFAELCHTGQKRRSGEPYIIHPIAVAEILMQWNMQVSLVVTGLLHDVLEDTDVSIKKIEELFGEEVALYVYVLSNNHFNTEKNLNVYHELCKNVKNAIIVKLADRLHNLQTLHSMPTHKKIEKTKETLALYIPLARILGYIHIAEELKKHCNQHFIKN